jgi:hypothetical protein
MSPQEKRHGVMARMRTSDLTIERRTLYHLSYPARHVNYMKQCGLKFSCVCARVLVFCLFFVKFFSF